MAALVRRAVHEAVSEALSGQMPAGDDGAVAVSVAEAARRIGIGTTKLKELIAAGQLESVLIDTRRLVPVESLQAYIGGLRNQQLQLPGLEETQ